MNWIDKIRNKPQNEKIRLIWLMVFIAAILLIALWVITARYSRRVPTDKTLLDTIGQGVRDIRNNYKK